VLTGAWEDEEVARAEQRPPRRYYQLTPEGKASMADIVDRFPALVRIFEGGAEPA
jgi:DNA-binding PadR family transcriptional regulator